VALAHEWDEILGALKNRTYAKDLDAQSRQLADEMNQPWVQPSHLKKDRFGIAESILVEVIGMLSEFGGLRDPRLKQLLSRYVNRYRFDSAAGQEALIALSTIAVAPAMAQLEQWSATSPAPLDLTLKRIVANEADDEPESAYFTICVREPRDPDWKERPYSFRVENGSLFLLARAEENWRWFAGQANDKAEAVRRALAYLERWIPDIDALDTQIASVRCKYFHAHVPGRYADCVHVLQQQMDFARWGLAQSHISSVYEYPLERPRIVYNSESCRVKFSFGSYGEIHDQSDILRIQYGRLHAPATKDAIMWQGELHNCWHDISPVLCYLDGMDVRRATEFCCNHPLATVDPASEYAARPGRPEVQAAMHARIWDKYGLRLFELFDLRRPDLWDRYVSFLKEVG
jgi:hypothetical protein